MKKHRIDYGDLGNRIAKRRKELRLSQKELADTLDCNESYISRVEKGKSKPSLEFVVLLAEELGVGVDYFFPYTVTGIQIAKLELQEKWDQWSPELIQFLNKIIDEAQEYETIVRSKEGN